MVYFRHTGTAISHPIPTNIKVTSNPSRTSNQSILKGLNRMPATRNTNNASTTPTNTPSNTTSPNEPGYSIMILLLFCCMIFSFRQ